MLLTAFAVAMDAVAVSITSGMTRAGRATWKDAFSMAAVFGAFQAAMPALGYAGGELLEGTIEAWDHWIAFGILTALGGRMIHGSLQGDEAPRPNPFVPRSLMILGLATSIDAAAVGLTLSIIDMPMAASVTIIGAVTFALCLPAVRLGAKLGSAVAHQAERVGGAVLLLVGVRILFEHLATG